MKNIDRAMQKETMQLPEKFKKHDASNAKTPINNS